MFGKVRWLLIGGRSLLPPRQACDDLGIKLTSEELTENGILSGSEGFMPAIVSSASGG